MPPRAQRLLSTLALAALLPTGMAACGTRLPDDAFAGRRTSGQEDGASSTDSGGSDGSSDDGGSATGTDGSDVGTTGGSTGSGTTTGGSTGGTGGSGTTGGASGPNQASDVGVTATTIRLGTIVAEQGVLGDAFAPAAWGLRAWTAQINASGGIAGRKVELFTCDDREDRARSLECARRLVETDKVFALVATNSRALGGAAEYLQQAGIPVLGFPIGNAFNRFSHFFSAYGSPYPRDNKAVGFDNRLVFGSGSYRYFKQKGAKTAAVFGYDIAESSQALELFQRGLELEGYAVKRYLVSFAAPSFDTAVAEMQRDGTDLIVDAMDGGANRRLCDAMSRRGFTVMAKVTQVPSFSAAAGTELNDTCRPITYIIGGSRPFNDTSVPFIATFNQAMQRYQRGKTLHQWALEAWVMADAVRQALVAMGPAPTRAGLEAFLEGPEGVDVPGVLSSPLSYVPRPEAATATRSSGCFAVAKWDDAKDGWATVDSFPICVKDSFVYTTPVAEDGT